MKNKGPYMIYNITLFFHIFFVISYIISCALLYMSYHVDFETHAVLQQCDQRYDTAKTILNLPSQYNMFLFFIFHMQVEEFETAVKKRQR